jgi:predicted  nucleic acid-binding Zn-ribbon protein
MAGSSREDRNALAAAMRTLQERINQLEREKQEILGREGEGEARNRRLERNDKEERELSKLVSALRDKEHEIKKLNRVNSDLSSRNAELFEKIQEMEDELNRCKSIPKHHQPAFKP